MYFDIVKIQAPFAVKCSSYNGGTFSNVKFQVKPKQAVTFNFNIGNEMNDDILIVGIHLAHPQPQFDMNEHPYVFGEPPHVLESSKFLINL